MMLKLHVACGVKYIPGWVNADINSNCKVDKVIDFRKPIPFPDKTFDFIYNEHFIEHLTLPEGIYFLQECRRILSGTMRISTPDLKIIAKRYVSNELTQRSDWKPVSLCDMMNEAMRKWGHKYLYDLDKLVSISKQVGFTQIVYPSYKESTHTELRDLESREYRNELILEIS
jgi:predicted SAM-dependent methyltransferase